MKQVLKKGCRILAVRVTRALINEKKIELESERKPRRQIQKERGARKKSQSAHSNTKRNLDNKCDLKS